MNRPPRGGELREIGQDLLQGRIKPQEVPNMTVRVGPITYIVNGKRIIEYSGGNSPVITKPTERNFAKWVAVGLNVNGTVDIIEGVAAPNNPIPPVIPKGFLLRGFVFVEGDDEVITESMVFQLSDVIHLGHHQVDHTELSGNDTLDQHPIGAVEGLVQALNDRVTFDELYRDILPQKADVDGTTSTVFRLNKDETGVPAQFVAFEVTRGNLPTVGFRWNEDIDIWEYTIDGSTWIQFSNAGFIHNANKLVVGKTRLSEHPVNPLDPVAVGNNDPRVLPASQSNMGVTKLSVDPANPAVPIAVGDNDPRNSNARQPVSHASTHVTGGDVIPDAVAGGNSGLMPGTALSRLNSITDSRLFDDLVQKGLVLNHLADENDPHNARGSHEADYDHTLLYKNTLTPFVVGPGAEDAYNTIQSAIDAAAAAGPTPSRKALVLVKPGTYPGNFAMIPNLIVSSVTGTNDRSVVVSGSVTVALAVDDMECCLRGLFLNRSSGNVVSFAGTRRQRLSMYNCDLQSNGGSGSVLSSTNTNTVTSEVFARGCNFLGVENFGGVLLDVSSARVVLEDCNVHAKDQIGTGEAIALSGTGKLFVSDCDIVGTSTMDDASSMSILESKIDLLLGSVVHNSSGPLLMLSNLVKKAAPGQPAVVGSGPVTYNHIVGYEENDIMFDPALGGGAGAVELPSTTSSRFTSYVPAVLAHWAAPEPKTVKEAIDRLAAALVTHFDGVPI